jgi:hypothetical protein
VTAKAFVEFSTVRRTGVGEFGSGSISVCDKTEATANTAKAATATNRNGRELLEAILFLLLRSFVI